MKKTLIFLSGLALYQHVLAVNPVEGFYAGFRAGGYYVPSLKEIPLPAVDGITTIATTPDLDTKIGFTGSLQGGYRFKEKYRLELELFVNYYEPHNLKLNGTQIAPTSNVSLEGDEYNAGAMINGYIDFFHHLGSEAGETVPYIGIGAGMASAHTELKFKADHQKTTTNNGSKFVSAMQGIIGFNYWADDYTSFGVDYRLQKLGKLSAFDSAPLAHNLSITMNFAFDDTKM